MKKYTFIFVALIAATLANAQITKVWSGECWDFGSGLQVVESGAISGAIIGNYFLSPRRTGSGMYYDIMDVSTLAITKSFPCSQSDGDVDGVPSWFGIKSDEYGPYFISKGIFSTDGKWAAVVMSAIEEIPRTEVMYNKICKEIQVRNEDGVVLETIPCNLDVEYGRQIKLVKAGDSFKLFVPDDKDYYYYDIYSLPGDGSAQDISTPSAPQRAIHKIVRNGQVLVETENNYYTIEGQEVK